MQLNIYIPKGKESLLSRLDSIAYRLGKAKNEIVICHLSSTLSIRGHCSVREIQLQGYRFSFPEGHLRRQTEGKRESAMIAVDTNVLVYAVMQDDSHHMSSRRLVETVAKGLVFQLACFPRTFSSFTRLLQTRGGFPALLISVPPLRKSQICETCFVWSILRRASG